MNKGSFIVGAIVGVVSFLSGVVLTTAAVMMQDETETNTNDIMQGTAELEETETNFVEEIVA